MEKRHLRQIIVDQTKEPVPSRLVERIRYQQIQPLVSNKQVIIISGIRRCGKSTLLQQVRRDAQESDYYINFDDDRLVQFCLQDFESLLEVFVEMYGEQHTFYFDEIQNVDGWERFVRRLHNNGNKVFITGSNAKLLSSELGTHLTGRHITVKLYPYSYLEYLRYINPESLTKDPKDSMQVALLKKHFMDYQQTGGMPEFIESRQKMYLQNLYENILYKDVIVRNKISLEKPIKELVYYLASNNAKEFTYNSLRKLLGLGSAKTVAEYCHHLEQSYICFVINRFSYSVKEQIHTAKKIYFIDHALAASIGFQFSEDQGRMLEQIVFLQLLRADQEIYFHKGRKECDFILRTGHKVTSAIQVCVSLKNNETRNREVAGLIEAMNTYGLSEGLIITLDESNSEELEIEGTTYKIKIMGCWEWILQQEF